MNQQQSRDVPVDKILGCLYGQAVGNALGLFCEDMSKSKIVREFSKRVERYSDCDPSGKGFWEDDDTMQMLCIMDELSENGKITEKGLAKRILHWLETDGVGCGEQTYAILTAPDYLESPIKTSKCEWENSACDSAPNGAIMRTAVVGIWNEDVENNALTAAQVTHYDPRCVGSAVIASTIVNQLIWNNKILSAEQVMEIARRYDDRLLDWVRMAKDEPISALNIDTVPGVGYTCRTLGVALWAYWHAQSFEDGLVTIVNEGGDADTNAAISCAILGAKFGYNSIPAHYIDNLWDVNVYTEKITNFANSVVERFG